MNITAPEPAHNRLLAALPQRERQRFLACLRPVYLSSAAVLNGAGSDARHVYFPLESCITVSTQVAGETALEIGLIGNEGMLGIGLLLGVEASAHVATVRGAGLALRVEAGPFRDELLTCPALVQVLMRYAVVLMEQLAQNATCSRFHMVQARLARLLLMTEDRANAQPMYLTHAALARRLGVRRAGITVAASALQRHALIAYHRGDIRILDRAGLRVAACGCYAADNDTYARIMGQ